MGQILGQLEFVVAVGVAVAAAVEDEKTYCDYDDVSHDEEDVVTPFVEETMHEFDVSHVRSHRNTKHRLAMTVKIEHQLLSTIDSWTVQ